MNRHSPIRFTRLKVAAGIDRNQCAPADSDKICAACFGIVLDSLNNFMTQFFDRVEYPIHAALSKGLCSDRAMNLNGVDARSFRPCLR